MSESKIASSPEQRCRIASAPPSDDLYRVPSWKHRSEVREPREGGLPRTKYGCTALALLG